MNNNIIPISTIFVGINGFIAFGLSYIVAIERTKTRIWHGESKQDVTVQSDYLENVMHGQLILIILLKS